MTVDVALDKKIADLQNRLAEIDRERASVLATLEQLKQRRTVEGRSTPTSQMADVVAGPPTLESPRNGGFLHGTNSLNRL